MLLEGCRKVEPDRRHVRAEHVKPEDASDAGRDIQSHDSSDDWTIVSDTSKTGAEPEAH